MKKHRCHMRSRGFLASLPERLGLALCLAAVSLPAAAVILDLSVEDENLVPPAALIGEWVAVVEENNYPQPVILRIDRIAPGKSAGKVTYSSPRRCVVDLEYGGTHEDQHIFYIIPFTNCFEYEKTDFIAISRVPEEPELPPESEEQRAPEPKELQQFKLRGTEEEKTAPPPEKDGESESGEESPPGQPERIDRILHAVTLGGTVRESAVMTRQ